MSEAWVTTTTAGQPLRLELGGSRYRVAAEPVQWFERRAWWEEAERAPKERCPHLVDREMWRVQVAADRPRGRRRAAVSDRELRTVELERDRDTGAWRLIDL